MLPASLSVSLAALLPVLLAMLAALPSLLVIAGCIWLLSLYLDKVSIIYYSWPLLLLAAAAGYLMQALAFNAVHLALIGMVALWALRRGYFAIKRDRQRPGDGRYKLLRGKSPKQFWVNSFGLIVVCLSLVAWVGSSNFAIVFLTDVQWSFLHSIATAVWLFGFIVEVLADNQLQRFNRLVVKTGPTLKTGLWRYSRHPNYFGELCMWWAWFLYAIPSGNGFILVAPVLVTGLLIKISAIELMEKEISPRRYDYRGYRASTNTLFPWTPREQVNGELYD